MGAIEENIQLSASSVAGPSTLTARSPRPKPGSKGKRKRSIEEQVGRTAESLTTFLQFHKKQTSDETFGQYVAVTLQQFNNKIKNRVKMEIMRLLEMYENDEIEINNCIH